MSLKLLTPSNYTSLVPVWSHLYLLREEYSHSIEETWSPVRQWSPVSLLGIITPAQTVISTTDHPAFPQPHAAPPPLSDWTSWMENEWALSAEHNISYVASGFRVMHTTHIPRNGGIFSLFHARHIVQWQIFHTLILREINSLVWETVGWDQTASRSGEIGSKQRMPDEVPAYVVL